MPDTPNRPSVTNGGGRTPDRDNTAERVQAESQAQFDAEADGNLLDGKELDSSVVNSMHADGEIESNVVFETDAEAMALIARSKECVSFYKKDNSHILLR